MKIPTSGNAIGLVLMICAVIAQAAQVIISVPGIPGPYCAGSTVRARINDGYIPARPATLACQPRTGRAGSGHD